MSPYCAYLVGTDRKSHAFPPGKERSLCGEAFPERWGGKNVPIIDPKMDLCPQCVELERYAKALRVLAGEETVVGICCDGEDFYAFRGGEWRKATFP